MGQFSLNSGLFSESNWSCQACQRAPLSGISHQARHRRHVWRDGEFNEETLDKPLGADLPPELGPLST